MWRPPAEIGRNEFDEWCWRRGLTLQQVADGLASVAAERGLPGAPSHEHVRKIRLPFSDPARRVPAAELAELIYLFTGGAVVGAHFYPPHLRGEPSLTPAAA